MSRVSTFKAAASVALGVLAVVSGCGTKDQPADGHQEGVAQVAAAPTGFRNVDLPTGYTGDDACFSCHEEIFNGFKEHGMARSYYPLTSENAVEDFSGVVLQHGPSDLSYRIYRKGDRFLQEEYRTDAAGRKTHSLIREMQFVVGSGTAARTYLTESNGWLYELPVTWYTQEKRWDFSPGYAEDNGRFDRLVPDRCMACHNSYPTAVPFTDGKYDAVPNGIGCERCHGPGELHVEERLVEELPRFDVDSTIVNPAHLSLERRLDVCQQCHLSGTVSFLREGREPFEFIPSRPLSEHLVLFSKPESDGEISVISHADRMRKSLCFTATQATSRPMDCTTCHDPHKGFRTLGEDYFNAVCQTCHSVETLRAKLPEDAQAFHLADSGCFDCHMPKVDVREAPHSSFTDHYIRIVADEVVPAASDDAQTPSELEPYFAEDERSELYEGMAWVVYGTQHGDTTAIRRGLATLDGFLDANPEHGDAQYLTGLSHLNLGEAAKAIPFLEASVRLDDDDPERLNALAQAYEQDRRNPVNIQRLYQKALAIQPVLAAVRLNYGRFLETQSRLADAVEQYQLAAAEQPWSAKAHFNLGTAYLQQGRNDDAENELKEALHLDPDYVEARGNLGLYYATRDRLEEARQQFEFAVQSDSTSSVALGNLGIYFLNAGELERSIDLLSRSVRHNPAYLDGHVNLALAYFRADRYDEARRSAERALALDPQNEMAQKILAAI